MLGLDSGGYWKIMPRIASKQHKVSSHTSAQQLLWYRWIQTVKVTKYTCTITLLHKKTIKLTYTKKLRSKWETNANPLSLHSHILCLSLFHINLQWWTNIHCKLFLGSTRVSLLSVIFSSGYLSAFKIQCFKLINSLKLKNWD